LCVTTVVFEVTSISQVTLKPFRMHATQLRTLGFDKCHCCHWAEITGSFAALVWRASWLQFYDTSHFYWSFSPPRPWWNMCEEVNHIPQTTGETLNQGFGNTKPQAESAIARHKTSTWPEYPLEYRIQAL